MINNGPSLNDGFIVMDIETSGVDSEKDEIIRISAVRVVDYEKSDRFERLIRPKSPLSTEIEKLTGITNDSLADCPSIEDVLEEFLNWHSGLITVYDRNFDIAFLEKGYARSGIILNRSNLDVLCVINKLYPNIVRRNSHVAFDALKLYTNSDEDVNVIAEIWIACLHRLKMLGVRATWGIDDVDIYRFLEFKLNNMEAITELCNLCLVLFKIANTFCGYKLLRRLKSHLTSFRFSNLKSPSWCKP